MNKAILFLFLIFIAGTAYAACDATDILYKGGAKAYTFKGKDYNITFLSFKNSSGGTSVKFKVNGISTPDLLENEKYTFDDISDITILDITWLKSSNASAQFCFTAGLVGFGKGKCSTNKDCDDNNSCTVDECDGDPLVCKRNIILWCRNDDGCCPKPRCDEKDDDDCALPKNILNETNISKINVTKISEDECSKNKDCNDNNSCTSDICLGSPKKCNNNATGCVFNGECFPVGKRTEKHFCNTDKMIKFLKPKKALCANDYECLSSKCSKNTCKSSFISWFKGLFGK